MKERDAYFDNAKFLLILLVVFGHLVRSFIEDSPELMQVYKLIYTFHMPAFILISGYFSKGFHKKGYLLKMAKKLLLPYAIFQIMYSVYFYLIKPDGTMDWNLLDPNWSLWFLLSLFYWNAMLFLFSKSGWKIAIPVAAAIGAASGCADFLSNYLSLSRTLVYFPVFLLGYFMKREHFALLASPVRRMLSIIVLFGTWAAFHLISFDFEWLHGSKPYGDFGAAGWEGIAIRLCLYGLTLLCMLSFLALVPSGETIFTKWGGRTLYVYLLHGFIINGIRYSHFSDWLKSHTAQLFLCIVLASFFTCILSTNAVRILAQPLIELRASQLRRVLGFL
ncbi:acyltransferase family protein [Metabacillus sp. GX 13764]|uniref:acyltransferase family protein n=1 Tax=Metabacillus kandeliae TaxID=2900151 RepID=UPI001E2D134C|nr:acyltransferase family protein [Metabacillus kandeliae]